MSVGYVYVLSNPDMPDLIKIGFTQNDPEVCAKELSAATGVPAPFLVEYWVICKTPRNIEQKIRAELDSFQASGNKEFFKCSISHAIAAISASGLEKWQDFERQPYTQKAIELAAQQKAELDRLKRQKETDAIQVNRERALRFEKETDELRRKGIKERNELEQKKDAELKASFRKEIPVSIFWIAIYSVGTILFLSIFLTFFISEESNQHYGWEIVVVGGIFGYVALACAYKLYQHGSLIYYGFKFLKNSSFRGKLMRSHKFLQKLNE